jgi:hypothetical protein
MRTSRIRCWECVGKYGSIASNTLMQVFIVELERLVISTDYHGF